MVGKTLGMGGTLIINPTYTLYSWVFIIYPPLLKGSILLMIGMTGLIFLVATTVAGKFIVAFCIEAQVDGTNLWNKVYLLVPS